MVNIVRYKSINEAQRAQLMNHDERIEFQDKEFTEAIYPRRRYSELSLKDKIIYDLTPLAWLIEFLFVIFIKPIFKITLNTYGVLDDKFEELKKSVSEYRYFVFAWHYIQLFLLVLFGLAIVMSFFVG